MVSFVFPLTLHSLITLSFQLRHHFWNQIAVFLLFKPSKIVSNLLFLSFRRTNLLWILLDFFLRILPLGLYSSCPSKLFEFDSYFDRFKHRKMIIENLLFQSPVYSSIAFWFFILILFSLWMFFIQILYWIKFLSLIPFLNSIKPLEFWEKFWNLSKSLPICHHSRIFILISTNCSVWSYRIKRFLICPERWTRKP